MWGLKGKILAGPYEEDGEFLKIDAVYTENIDLTLTAASVGDSWEEIKREFIFQFSQALNRLERTIKPRG